MMRSLVRVSHLYFLISVLVVVAIAIAAIVVVATAIAATGRTLVGVLSLIASAMSWRFG